MVVVVLPGCRDRSGVAEAVKDLQGEALVSKSSVDALGEAVLPRTAGCGVSSDHGFALNRRRPRGWPIALQALRSEMPNFD